MLSYEVAVNDELLNTNSYSIKFNFMGDHNIYEKFIKKQFRNLNSVKNSTE